MSSIYGFSLNAFEESKGSSNLSDSKSLSINDLMGLPKEQLETINIKTNTNPGKFIKFFVNDNAIIDDKMCRIITFEVTTQKMAISLKNQAVQTIKIDSQDMAFSARSYISAL